MTDKKIKQHIIMKRFLYPIALTAVLMAAASCNDSLSERDLGDFPPSGGMAAVSISCKPLPSEEAETRSKFAYGDVERKKMIRSVQVFVYGLDGALAGVAYWDNGTPVARFTKVDLEEMLDDGTLDEETPYVFFFLGNLPQVLSQEVPSTAEAMEGWTYGFSDYSTFDTYGFPMAAVRGKGEGAKVYDLVGQEIELLRLVSQWTVNFQDAESGLTYDDLKVYIRNAARTMQPFSDAPAPAEVFDNKNAFGDSEAVSIGENGVMFYVLENMQGEAFPGSGSMGNRVIIGNQIDATYIEIKSSAQSNNGPLVFENTTYRYVLGDIEGLGYSNADVRRHTEFTLALNFSATADESTPEYWQKEISEPYLDSPYIGFDYDGVIINHADGYLPFDDETKRYINEYGEEIEVAWADGVGPVGDTGEPLISLSVDDGGILFAPTAELQEYTEWIQFSNKPKNVQYKFVLEKRDWHGGGVRLSSFVSDLNDYSIQSSGVDSYIGVSFSGEQNAEIKLSCTNALSPYSINFPVHYGPVIIEINPDWETSTMGTSGLPRWTKVGDAAMWYYYAKTGQIAMPNADVDYFKYGCAFMVEDESSAMGVFQVNPVTAELVLDYQNPNPNAPQHFDQCFTLSHKDGYASAGIITTGPERVYSKDWFNYITAIINDWNAYGTVNWTSVARLKYGNDKLYCTGGRKTELKNWDIHSTKDYPYVEIKTGEHNKILIPFGVENIE